MSDPPNPNPNQNPERSSSQKPICIVCYEDLNPLTEHLQCVPSCGHVLHELCLQQWVEYCGKKPTCPVCKQPCGARQAPTRLYFQSTSADEAADVAQPARSAAELADEVARLTGKVKALTQAIGDQKNVSKKLSDEVEVYKKLGESEKAGAEKLKREKQMIQQHLNIKIEEVSRKTMECSKLQEKSLALAKELVALKLATDMNLDEEEIGKFALLGNSSSPQNALEILNKSLAMRNKSYRELMAQCNILGRSERKAQQKLDKAKEQIKKLKARLLELEKENEERENGALRDLKTSNKKLKSDGDFQNSTKMSKNEVIDLDNDTSFMEMDEFLGSKRKISNNYTNNVETEKVDFEQWTPFQEKTGEEKRANENLPSGISVINKMESQADQIGVQIHDTTYCTDKFGNLGVKRSIGKWCKNEGIHKMSGDLISVGPDGRGGRIKILKSLNPFQDRKTKVGPKGGQSQIEQFFGKR